MAPVSEKADERRSANVSNLKAKLLEKIQAHRPRTTKLVKEQGKIVIDQVTIDQCIGGARDIRSLVTDISYLDPQEGIRFRGKTIPETFAALPKVPGSDYPYVEGFWYFLMTGDVPTSRPVRLFPSTCSTSSARCRATRTRWPCSPPRSCRCSGSPSS
jgi:hypothetical protein